MVENKHLAGVNCLDSNALHRVMLMQVIGVLLAFFNKKGIQPVLHLKKWEYEKVTLLGLSTQPRQNRYSSSRNDRIKTWEHEKMLHFGLSELAPHKKMLRNLFSVVKEHYYDQTDETQHYEVEPNPLPKPQKSVVDSQPVMESKAVKAKKPAVDDFFKILGYE